MTNEAATGEASTPKKRRLRKRWVLLVLLAAVAVAVWPGGPFRPRAGALSTFVPDDAALVARLAPSRVLRHPLTRKAVAESEVVELIDEWIEDHHPDAPISGADVVRALGYVDEVAVALVDDDPLIVARLSPAAHAVAFADRFWDPPDDVFYRRDADVVVIAFDEDSLDGANALAGGDTNAVRSFDAWMAWEESADDAVRVWARPESALLTVPDDAVARHTGEVGRWLRPEDAGAISLTIELEAEDGVYSARCVLDHGAALPRTLASMIEGGGPYTWNEQQRAHSQAERTLWAAGLSLRSKSAARALFEDLGAPDDDAERAADFFSRRLVDGVALAMAVPEPADGVEPPASLVASFLLRPGVSHEDIVARCVDLVERATGRFPTVDTFPDGRRLVREKTWGGPAIAVGHGEFVVYQDSRVALTRAEDRPPVGVQSPPDVRADVEVLGEAVAEHERLRASQRALRQVHAELAQRERDSSRLLDLEAARAGLTGEDARAYRERRLAETAELAMTERLPELEERYARAAARWEALSLIAVRLRVDGGLVTIELGARAAE